MWADSFLPLVAKMRETSGTGAKGQAGCVHPYIWPSSFFSSFTSASLVPLFFFFLPYSPFLESTPISRYQQQRNHLDCKGLCVLATFRYFFFQFFVKMTIKNSLLRLVFLFTCVRFIFYHEKLRSEKIVNIYREEIKNE